MLDRLFTMPEITWTGLLIGAGLFAVTSIGGLALVSVLLVKLPAAYFAHSRPRTFWVDRHPLVRMTGVAVKNVLGAIAIPLGLVMSIPGIPGPGLLVAFIGVMLLDFPGKRKLETRLISYPAVFEAINNLRRRHGKPPLILD
ncbi:MAG: hypothetical protein K2X35_11575 [Bryobacteraceae bacterium]|nr:hypothetical protein [Bryobacteraceae bacterium]